ncbi:hypothetical protein BOW53_13810 [Solemya pervernicosa gill symbiont]|uniref:Type I secretion protein TolC n=2 Tax=Gammaproteobacteria incertae sedis TaxID=118884 RepID=A0A1T2L1C3_9GAMM|nr:hypothetical protein BOW53_13810 [Solemya pervernicosa gill symbiont]
MNSFAKKLALTLLFTPLAASAENLMEVYHQAQQSDPTFKAAEATYRAAQEAKPQSQALLLPNISFSVDAGANRVNQYEPSSGEASYGSVGYGLSLSQPIYHSDYNAQLRQADATVLQAEATLAAEQQALLLRVAESYFGVLAAHDALKFARAEKGAIARQLEQAKKRFEVGLIAITDVHEAQAAFDLAVSQEIDAQNGLTNSYEALSEVTGVSTQNLSLLGEQMQLLNPSPEDIEAWAEAALKDNLTLKAVRHGLETAREEVTRQRAGHAPTLDLVGSHSYSKADGGITSESERNTTSLMLQLNVPIYSGGAVNSRTREAEENYTAAKQNVEAQRRSVLRQTRDAYRGVDSSISKVNALKQALVSTGSALEATEAGFEVGTRTIVDVLNAQSEQHRARNNYANARYDYILNTLRLKQAAGRLEPNDLEQINAWLN